MKQKRNIIRETLAQPKNADKYVFTKAINTRGGLWSSFVFKDQAERDAWKSTELPKLQEQYGQLELSEYDLPGLKVGNTCNVFGDGIEQYKIVRVVKFSPYRYGFVLDSGVVEEVAKCHDEHLQSGS